MLHCHLLRWQTLAAMNGLAPGPLSICALGVCYFLHGRLINRFLTRGMKLRFTSSPKTVHGVCLHFDLCFQTLSKGSYTHTGQQASQSEVWALALSQDKWLQDFGPGFLLWVWDYEIGGIYSQLPVQRPTVEDVTWKTRFKRTKTSGTAVPTFNPSAQSSRTGIVVHTFDPCGFKASHSPQAGTAGMSHCARQGIVFKYSCRC